MRDCVINSSLSSCLRGVTWPRDAVSIVRSESCPVSSQHGPMASGVVRRPALEQRGRFQQGAPSVSSAGAVTGKS